MGLAEYPPLSGGSVGKVAAVLGSGLCGAILIGGLTVDWLAYATEVPDGYQRISFANLQRFPSTPNRPYHPEALKLNGQRIFVKGYLYPDGQQDDVKHFVLVPDMGTCCFGGQPKLTDMIEVTLEDPLRAEFARRKRRLGGILTVDTAVLKPVSGLGGVYFTGGRLLPLIDARPGTHRLQAVRCY